MKWLLRLLLFAIGCTTTQVGSTTTKTGYNTTQSEPSSYGGSKRIYFENGCSFEFNSDWALVTGSIHNVNGRSIAKNVRYNTEAVCKYDEYSDGSFYVNAAIGLLPYEIDCHKGLPRGLRKYFPTTQAEAKRISENSLKKLGKHYAKATKASFPERIRKGFEYIEFDKINISSYYGLASRFRFTHSNSVTYDAVVVMIPLDGHLVGFYWMHPETLGRTYDWVPILYKRKDIAEVLTGLKVSRLSISK